MEPSWNLLCFYGWNYELVTFDTWEYISWWLVGVEKHFSDNTSLGFLYVGVAASNKHERIVVIFKALCVLILNYLGKMWFEIHIFCQLRI